MSWQSEIRKEAIENTIKLLVIFLAVSIAGFGAFVGFVKMVM